MRLLELGSGRTEFMVDVFLGFDWLIGQSQANVEKLFNQLLFAYCCVMIPKQ
jgi:hypothetical protein